MMRKDLKKLTTLELVKRFEEIALAQDKADLYDEIKKYNTLYSEMELVSNELKSRSGDHRRELFALHRHRNALVRFKAAIHTLALAPSEARAVLQTISDRNEYPAAADARGILNALDEGRYIPD